MRLPQPRASRLWLCSGPCFSNHRLYLQECARGRVVQFCAIRFATGESAKEAAALPCFCLLEPCLTCSSDFKACDWADKASRVGGEGPWLSCLTWAMTCSAAVERESPRSPLSSVLCMWQAKEQSQIARQTLPQNAPRCPRPCRQSVLLPHSSLLFLPSCA